MIPHMGWNVVDAPADTRLFKGLDADTRFYFVHSYAAQQWEGNADAQLTWATHTRAVPGRRRGRTAGRHPVPPGEERRRGGIAFGQLG